MNFVFLESFFADFREIATQIADTPLGACAAGCAICVAALQLFSFIISERKIL